MKLLKYILPLLFPVINAGGQGITASQKITGRVVSASGHTGVSGVTVSFKKQKTIAVTDHEGNFSIQTNGQSDTLIFSHVSFKRKLLEIGKLSAVP